jgi:site-specific DNA recombinase
MGRLVLNMLLSFAQFEREMISERTRDKIAATRRKGKWCGGVPILGYDVDRSVSKLIVNHQEAPLVREIFDLYIKHRALSTVVAQLRQRGWRNRRWTTRKGAIRGGRPFTKTTLYNLLTNVTYVGKLCYKKEVHEGEHEAIVDERLFKKAQRILKQNGRHSGNGRVASASLLKGRLYCAACRCAMTPSFAVKGRRRYRYYVCTRAQKQGRAACPSQALPAAEIERFVLDQLKELRNRPDLDASRLEAALSEELRTLVQRVDYDGRDGTLNVLLDPETIHSMQLDHARERQP